MAIAAVDPVMRGEGARARRRLSGPNARYQLPLPGMREGEGEGEGEAKRAILDT